MIGTFHHPSTADWFGIYHHERRWGLLHLADPDRLPGKKLWSFGHTGSTSDWTLSMTRDGGRSCEIQAGVPALQEQHLDLGPGNDLAFVEIWQSVDHQSELDEENRPTFAAIVASIGGISDAPRALPPVDARVPGWDTAESKLRNIAEWAKEIEGWQRPGTPRGIARALLARILLNVRLTNEVALPLLTEAAKELRDGSLLEELDTLLLGLGRTGERRDLLAYWPAGDHRKHEVEASIEIDDGNVREGLELLLTTPWERHHCRHRRTKLWCRGRALLNEPVEPFPVELKEDPYVVPG
jgi:hypothetical protein